MKTLNLLAFLVLGGSQISCSSKECVETHCQNSLRIRVSSTDFGPLPNVRYRVTVTAVEDGFTSTRECQIPSPDESLKCLQG